MKTTFNEKCSSCQEKIQVKLNIFKFNIPEIIKHNIKILTINE